MTIAQDAPSPPPSEPVRGSAWTPATVWARGVVGVAVGCPGAVVGEAPISVTGVFVEPGGAVGGTLVLVDETDVLVEGTGVLVEGTEVLVDAGLVLDGSGSVEVGGGPSVEVPPGCGCTPGSPARTPLAPPPRRPAPAMTRPVMVTKVDRSIRAEAEDRGRRC